MKRGLLTLVTSVAFVLSLGAQQDPRDPNDPKKNPQQENRGISPEEAARRKDEVFKDAEEAAKKFRSWKAKVTISEAVPGGEGMLDFDGAVWAKAVNEKEWAFTWELKQWETQIDGSGAAKRVDLEISRCLYKGVDLQIAYDTKKILECYEFKTFDWFLPQVLLRDGPTKKLEEYFTVQITCNPRYLKTQRDEMDWVHLGFKDEKDFKERTSKWKGRTTGNVETNRPEFGSYDDKIKKIEEKNPNYKKEAGRDENAQQQFYYAIQLTPITPQLKRDVKSIMWVMRPGDFLTVFMKVEVASGADLTIKFDNHVKDPAGEEEIKDDRFKLEATGYVQKWPQRE